MVVVVVDGQDKMASAGDVLARFRIVAEGVDRDSATFAPCLRLELDKSSRASFLLARSSQNILDLTPAPCPNPPALLQSKNETPKQTAIRERNRKIKEAYLVPIYDVRDVQSQPSAHG